MMSGFHLERPRVKAAPAADDLLLPEQAGRWAGEHLPGPRQRGQAERDAGHVPLLPGFHRRQQGLCDTLPILKLKIFSKTNAKQVKGLVF